jgi:hypothetical protein
MPCPVKSRLMKRRPERRYLRQRVLDNAAHIQ